MSNEKKKMKLRKAEKPWKKMKVNSVKMKCQI